VCIGSQVASDRLTLTEQRDEIEFARFARFNQHCRAAAKRQFLFHHPFVGDKKTQAARCCGGGQWLAFQSDADRVAGQRGR